ncbi:Uncharacterized membrane protein [Methanolobus vulcani]|jgi:Predicted membrane protein|uniref:Uncharacterized membrane protein n=1 Tax=Methanolobus vulcani TaxID=38026 RepID=A0A7Z7AV60_9EURY|nr:DUF1003 domain-containing protein [Methanolobus vulcani]MDK2824881.1 hypothetical protein [Methanolobus sp.]SDF51243.1 Uncharacterized membrane protein [Methanolobus vulcani]
MKQKMITCEICGQSKKMSEVVPLELVSKSVMDIILKEHPECSSTGHICISDLNRFRQVYINDLLETERGELSKLEEEVVQSLREQDFLSKNINLEFDRKLTFGERLSDRLADFAGSWFFICSFTLLTLFWIAINTFLLISKPFDPYPYILLNLMLSCLAAIQAPFILMSQNRQEAKDRLQAEYDYRVNLKSELEIRTLHEKMDHLLMYQFKRFMEIQEIQIEMMEEILEKNVITEVS